MEDNTIIRDLRVLQEAFIPSRLIHRDGQLQAVRDCVAPLTEDNPPRHAFLHGPPGTGKTTLSKYVLEELKKETPVLTSYVNCWEDSTRFGVLFTILKGMGAFIHRKGTPTDELLQTLRTKLENTPCILILDEVDQLEEDKILYDLLQAGAGLIMISNSETALAGADPRIRSRLAGTDTIPFAAYSHQELVDILHDRTEWGLVPGVIKRAQLEAIADLAAGDARTALGTLALAAQKAEDQSLEAIPDTLLTQARPQFETDSRQRALEKLSPTQQTILDIITTKKQLPSGELFTLLNQKDPTPERTFRKHMQRLVRNGLVTAVGDGRWRTYTRA